MNAPVTQNARGTRSGGVERAGRLGRTLALGAESERVVAHTKKALPRRLLPVSQWGQVEADHPLVGSEQ